MAAKQAVPPRRRRERPERLLERYGVRPTPQRVAVLGELIEPDDVTAQELHRRLGAAGAGSGSQRSTGRSRSFATRGSSTSSAIIPASSAIASAPISTITISSVRAAIGLSSSWDATSSRTFSRLLPPTASSPRGTAWKSTGCARCHDSGCTTEGSYRSPERRRASYRHLATSHDKPVGLAPARGAARRDIDSHRPRRQRHCPRRP